ncbi:hypothetical protein FJU30_17675 [Affinibrenneria salicis]|uniref:Uncharacterized protein n=1 Tax=Affinibrenneria salicis TaxID=2590031 RepID=A0A5J5FXB6_9GAMM|nr:hypothetical protein [Affinibrenneria salicis]KAA8997609.1 hypothetical protein FJU30_17675 [Affinibrenneria salicis]
MRDNAWRDMRDRREQWRGLMLYVASSMQNASGLQMLTGGQGRMKLTQDGATLYWATMARDHSGIWLIRNTERDAVRPLIAPIRSPDVTAGARQAPDRADAFWCRFFARQLFADSCAFLTPGRWLMSPMKYCKPSAPRPIALSETPDKWFFHSPSAKDDGYFLNDSLYGEALMELMAQTDDQPVCWVDWWWRSERVLNLRDSQPAGGRVKWWRKVSRAGSLPPILLWRVAGLSSWVILDGHDRLCAALAEGIPPHFIALSEVGERRYPPDPEQQRRILSALEQQQRRHPGMSVDSLNQRLIAQFNDHAHLYSVSRSRVRLGNGEEWLDEITRFLHRRRLGEFLPAIAGRESE